MWYTELIDYVAHLSSNVFQTNMKRHGLYRLLDALCRDHVEVIVLWIVGLLLFGLLHGLALNRSFHLILKELNGFHSFHVLSY